MKKIRIMIIIVVIIIMIISLLLFIYIKKDGNSNIPDETEVTYEDYYDPSLVNYTIQQVENRNNYYEIKSIVEKFYTYRFMQQEAELQEYQKNEINSAIYYMLDTDYKSDKNISEKNVIDKMPECDYTDAIITKMNEAQVSENVYVYLINGRLINRKNSNKNEFYILIKVDMFNYTFSIYLDDFANKYSNKLGNKIDIISKNIEKNQYNTFQNTTISEEDYIKDLFSRYRFEALFDKEIAYKCLNEEYAKKRFGNFENYNLYLDNNIKEVLSMKLNRYLVNKYDKYIQYICEDQFGNVCIFNESNPMEYEVFLDTYTIDLPLFIEKYNSANAKGKVMLNIDKFINSINNKDYKYGYSVLSESFKANNKIDYEKFKNYIENNLFEKNNVEYLTFKEENNAYSYKITLTDKNGSSDKKINLYIAMQLENAGTGFKVAFSIE